MNFVVFKICLDKTFRNERLLGWSAVGRRHRVASGGLGTAGLQLGRHVAGPVLRSEDDAVPSLYDYLT